MPCAFSWGHCPSRPLCLCSVMQQTTPPHAIASKYCVSTQVTKLRTGHCLACRGPATHPPQNEQARAPQHFHHRTTFLGPATYPYIPVSLGPTAQLPRLIIMLLLHKLDFLTRKTLWGPELFGNFPEERLLINLFHAAGPADNP
jgi:hypothetical protein